MALALPAAVRLVPAETAPDLVVLVGVRLLAAGVGVVAVAGVLVLLAVGEGEVVAAFIESLMVGVLGVQGLLEVPLGLVVEAVVLCPAAWARSLAMRCIIALGVQSAREKCQPVVEDFWSCWTVRLRSRGAIKGRR